MVLRQVVEIASSSKLAVILSAKWQGLSRNHISRLPTQLRSWSRRRNGSTMSSYTEHPWKSRVRREPATSNGMAATLDAKRAATMVENSIALMESR